MKVLFAASEAVPFCKTGGLADVAGALTEALRRRPHDVRLVLPKYRSISTDAFGLRLLPFSLRIPLAGRVEEARAWEGTFGPGVPAYFIDAPGFFNRDGLYRSPDGKDFPDNDRRFILYSRAALELAKALEWRPDIVHAHDWQAGLIPAYLGTIYAADRFFAGTASVFTIHNIAYQGLFPRTTLLDAGFAWEHFTMEKLWYYGQMNFLKAGLVYSTLLSTVSPTYAEEVQASEDFGRGMEGVLRVRSRDFFGVINGIDERIWDPMADPLLAKKFSPLRRGGRAECKADLQKAAGLKPEPRAPLLGMVSRLDPQKGFDILLDILEEFLKDGAQAVFLGQGSAVYEASLKTLARKFPGRLGASTDFNESLAHKIYGGSDIFLMPSRFEPCGLGQMIALRYGAVPVVTPTGGLRDTVTPVAPDGQSGVGFVAASVSEQAYRAALAESIRWYRKEPARWSAIQARGMRLRFGWRNSVAKYVELYRLARARKNSPKPVPA